MPIFYTDQQVLPKVVEHVYQVYNRESIDYGLCVRVREYLERTIPGSAWRVLPANRTKMSFHVQFDTEEHLTWYRMQWS